MPKLFRAGRIVLAMACLVGGANRVSAQVGLPNGGNQQLRNRHQEADRKAGAVTEDAVKNLRDQDANRRLEAVKQLAGSQEKQSVEYLIEATGDSDARVKLKAIDSRLYIRYTYGGG